MSAERGARSAERRDWTLVRQIRHLLIIRNDRLGDLVLTLPAIAAARRALPDAKITLLASPLAAPLVAAHPDIDEVLFDDPADGAVALARRLRALRADAGLAINYSRRNCLALWLAGIPRRVGWGYKLAGCLAANRRVWLHRSRPPIHEADFALAFVRALGLSVPAERPAAVLPIAETAWREMLARIDRELGQHGPLVGVHPGGRGSAYYWPTENFAQLVARLAQRSRVIVTGTPAERTQLETIAAAVAPPVARRVALWDDLTLPQLAATLAACQTVVAGSTGPLHVAAAVGTRVVGLYSSHPAHVPAKWAPLGAGHVVLQAPLAPGEDPRIPPERGGEHMARIGVDHVLAAVEHILQQAQAA